MDDRLGRDLRMTEAEEFALPVLQCRTSAPEGCQGGRVFVRKKADKQKLSDIMEEACRKCRVRTIYMEPHCQHLGQRGRCERMLVEPKHRKLGAHFDPVPKLVDG